MGKTTAFEVIAGSYEEFLLGYNFSSKESKLVQGFAAHDHTASVRCVASSGHYLASGGADDRIFVYDMKSRKEHCSLTHHNATVNALQFTDKHTHLISGSADGTVAIVRVGNWQLEKVWEKAHKGSILDIAVHPTGKLALTLGSDLCLCTWNLIKGRQAYIINLNSKSKDPKSLEKIVWHSDGVRFILWGGKYTEVWSIETGGVLKQFEHGEKVTSCIWLSGTTMLTGHEDGQLNITDIESEEVTQFQGHESRVKSIQTFKTWIISVSSNGQIKIWSDDFDEVASFDTGCRLTCLCIIPPIKVKKEDETNESEEVSQVPQVRKRTTARVIETVEESEDEVEEVPQVKKSKAQHVEVIVEKSKGKKKKRKNKSN